MAYQQSTHQAVNFLGLQCLAGALSGHPCRFTKDDRDMRLATVDVQIGDCLRYEPRGYIEHVVMAAIQDLLSMVWISGEKPGASLLILERDATSISGLEDSYLSVSSTTQICLGMRVAEDWMNDQITLRYDLQFRIEERPSSTFYYDPNQAISNQFLGRSNVRNNWNP